MSAFNVTLSNHPANRLSPRESLHFSAIFEESQFNWSERPRVMVLIVVATTVTPDLAGGNNSTPPQASPEFIVCLVTSACGVNTLSTRALDKAAVRICASSTACLNPMPTVTAAAAALTLSLMSTRCRCTVSCLNINININLPPGRAALSPVSQQHALQPFGRQHSRETLPCWKKRARASSGFFYPLNPMPAVTVTAALAPPSLLRPGRAALSPVSEHALMSFRKASPCHRLGLQHRVQ
jgi:hypothetical protein